MSLLHPTRRLCSAVPALLQGTPLLPEGGGGRVVLLVDAERLQHRQPQMLGLSGIGKRTAEVFGSLAVRRVYVDLEKSGEGDTLDEMTPVFRECLSSGFETIHVKARRRGKTAPCHIRIMHDIAVLESDMQRPTKHIVVATSPAMRVGLESIAPLLSDSSLHLWMYVHNPEEVSGFMEAASAAGLGCITPNEIAVPFAARYS